MPVSTRIFNGNLNTDSSKYMLPAGDFTAARNISEDARIDSQDGNVNDFVGNRLVNSSSYQAGDKVVGAVADSYRNRILFMVYRSNGKHKIMQYDRATDSISLLFTDYDQSAGDNTLELQAGSFIQMNIINRQDGEGDLLFFLNGAGKPCMLNIERTADGSRIPLTAARISVHKAPPEDVPRVEYRNDATRRINNLRNKLFKFRYRFVYEDGNKSVWSGVSVVPMPKGELLPTEDSDPGNNNNIVVSMSTGPIEVRKIELAVSVSVENAWSDFLLVDSFKKDDRDITNNGFFYLNFYNDGAYPAIDINESNLLFDYVPFIAEAQDLANGNVPVYGTITEGYDQTIIPDVKIVELTEKADSPQQSGTLSVTRKTQSPPALGVIKGYYLFTFAGSPVPGTVVTFKSTIIETGTVDYEVSTTVLEGDTIVSIADRLDDLIVASSWIENDNNDPGDPIIGVEVHGSRNPTIEITSPGTGTGNNSSRSTFLWGTKRRLGLVYYDKNGVTPGVVTRFNLYDSGLDSNEKDFEVSFAQYAEEDSIPLLPYIKTEINHQPPSWARYYHWVISKNLTIGEYLFTATRDVLNDADYLYFDVSNILHNSNRSNAVSDVVRYEFAKGDRMRLIKDLTGGTTYDDTYDAEVVGFLTNPKINEIEQTGNFVKVKKTGGIGAVDYTSNTFVIQLYSPYQVDGGQNEVYYEFGQVYQVYDLNGTLYHAGQIRNQSATESALTEIRSGDAYYRSRTMYLNEAADGLSIFNLMDNNFVDSYKSAVSSISGRPLVVDVNAKRSFFPAMVRFGLSYQQGTNINDTNRFYPANFDEYDISFGKIKRLKTRDRNMRVFQELKCGMVPVYQQIIKDAAGGDVLAQSDRLLNKIQYYQGNYGIGDCPESLASNNFADYFVDNRRGVVCRLSMDGITPISIVMNVNSWATSRLPLRGTSSKVYGVFDAEFNRYIMFLEAVGDDPAETMVFSEKTKGFRGNVDLYPEQAICLDTLLAVFKNGKLWLHDIGIPCNFFDVQYKPSITAVFNDVPMVKKNFTNIKIVANKLWVATEITTSLGQVSELDEVDYRKKEDSYNSGFWRDTNSPGGLLNGDRLKGNWMEVKFEATNAGTESNLVMATVIFNESQLNAR